MDHLGDALTPVLVTGAAGYLGGRVLAALARQGRAAVGVARTAGASHAACDLLDRPSVAALVAAHPGSPLIHCAAVVPRTADGYAAGDAAEQSVAMVENLVSAGAGPIVFASSMTVYPAGIGVAREDRAGTAAAGYAAGKLRAEEALRRAAGRLDVILRFPGLFGPPRTTGVLYNAALALARGQRPVLADPLPQWAAIHVDDAADLCVRALRFAGREALVLNAGYPGAMAIPAAVAQLASLLDADPGPLPAAPEFAFDLTRLESTIGPAAGGWAARLEELAAAARAAAGGHGA